MLDYNFNEIEIANPGFINIKLSSAALIKNINLILNNTVMILPILLI